VIRVVERIGRVLDAFTVERPELTLTECAEATELNKSSALRLLASLEEIGLVERREMLWRLGPRAVTLATLRLGRVELRRESMPYLRELRHAFRAAVAFSVPDGADMIYLERLDSPDAYGVSARLGARNPIWAGASGRAILSRLSPAERDLCLDVEEWSRLPTAVRDRVLEEVQTAAERGYCIDAGDFFFNGIGGIAVALRDTHGEPVAALSVIVPAETLSPDYAGTIAERLTSSAAELERTIGFQLPPPVTAPAG
jgi:IclR family transcriptional regulator, pca regulon regulatory protein